MLTDRNVVRIAPPRSPQRVTAHRLAPRRRRSRNPRQSRLRAAVARREGPCSGGSRSTIFRRLGTRPAAVVLFLEVDGTMNLSGVLSRARLSRGRPAARIITPRRRESPHRRSLTGARSPVRCGDEGDGSAHPPFSHE